MRFWEGRNAYVCYVCNIEAHKELFEVDFASLPSNLRFINDSGPWKVYSMDTLGVLVSIYRKRLLLLYPLETGQDYLDTDIIIREFLKSRDEKLVALNQFNLLFGDAIRGISRYPVLFINDFRVVQKPRKHSQSFINRITWLDNGVTTFFYRIFDSSALQISYLRVSRHLVVCYGLSDNVIYDLVNLVYEKFLYTPRLGDVSTDDVFNLLDGLNRYTVPTELNLFLQDVGLRLAIYLTIVAILISLAQMIASGISLPYLQFLPYVTTVILAVVVWKVLARLSFLVSKK